MTYLLTIGQHQLAVSLNRKLGRPQKKLTDRFSDFVNQLFKFARDKRRNGQPISRALRFIFENKKTRQIFGLNLALVVLLTGISSSPISAFSQKQESEATTLNIARIELQTENSVRVPLNKFEITQGFNLLHRGIDLKEVTGSPVYPIMDGVVDQVVYDRFSYGNHLIINHGSGFKSLYAHLSKITVKQGDKVDKNSVLGAVGTTGWVTGPHLHLEIYDHEQPFNPLSILR